MEKEEWKEICSASDREEAERLFDRWRVTNELESEQLADNDIRVDVVRTLEKKTLYRYKIRNK